MSGEGDGGSKLWGGRFSKGVTSEMEKFNSSISYDKRMWRADIDGSIAYAKAIRKCGIITEDELNAMIEGLETVRSEWLDGKFVLLPSDEDIHTANERRLTELKGEVGKKLHTGRSRNDQVATDTRLWLRDEIKALLKILRDTIQTFVARAKSDQSVIMPGYTHMQQAQPIRWSHWLLSYASMLQRDYERLSETFKRTNVLPLGSGALAGNPFDIDREYIAELLGFDAITTNSLDGTSDRDFVSEFLFWSSMTCTHLSRFAEDLIIYSTKEFSFIVLADEYSTGSSLMPQKKNPDSLELIRGKCGRLIGHLTGMMCTIKGLPMTYNKDLQEDKEPLFDAVETISGVINIAHGVVATLKVNPERMLASLSPEMLATDIAYYLVRRGVPFREAHHVSGECVCLAESKGLALDKLSVADFLSISASFQPDIVHIFDYEKSIEQYSAHGGTGSASINWQIDTANKWLEANQ
jgi:argininosuccinate lyase